MIVVKSEYEYVRNGCGTNYKSSILQEEFR